MEILERTTTAAKAENIEIEMTISNRCCRLKR